MLLTVVLASGGVVLFCFIADPYRLYPSIPYLSPDTSVDRFLHLRLHTPYALEQARPTVLVAGNSRSAVLPPQSLASAGEIAYNASVPGAKLHEIRRLVEHAHTVNPLRVVVIGLDQIMFRNDTVNEAVQEGLNRNRKKDPGLTDRVQFAYQRLVDCIRSLFSLDAIRDSWRTLAGDSQSNIDFRDDGSWDLEATVTGPRNIVYRRLAMKIYRTQLAEKSQGLEFGELMALLDFTDANGIQTILLISPMQGLILNTIALAGAWEQYLNWQRDLVTRVSARGTATAIYGVEDNPRFVMEDIDTPKPLFRDGVHYTRRAASEIVACIAGPCEEGFRPTLLNDQTITTYLGQVDALRRQYADNNPAEIAKAREWIRREQKDAAEIH